MFGFIKKLFEPKPPKKDPLDAFDEILRASLNIKIKIAQQQRRLNDLKMRNLQGPIPDDELEGYKKEIEIAELEIENMIKDFEIKTLNQRMPS